MTQPNNVLNTNDMNNEEKVKKIVDSVYKSGLHDLLMDCMTKTYKYDSLTCNLGYGCKITFEINVSPEQDANRQL